MVPHHPTGTTIGSPPPLYSKPTHVAKVIPGVTPLAELAVQPVQVQAENLQHLAAVQAELVHRRGDVVAADVVNNASLGEARQFLKQWRGG